MYIFTLNTVKVHQELFLVNKVSECQRRLSVIHEDDDGSGGDDVDHDNDGGDDGGGHDDDEDIVIQSHWDRSASLEIIYKILTTLSVRIIYKLFTIVFLKIIYKLFTMIFLKVIYKLFTMISYSRRNQSPFFIWFSSFNEISFNICERRIFTWRGGLLYTEGKGNIYKD